MIEALQIAATGMKAQQQSVDTIANNLVNVNTMGFKRARVSFTDLVTRQAAAAPQDGAGLEAIGEAAKAGGGIGGGGMGVGVATASVLRSFDQGEARQTGSAYDVMIDGDGFFEVVLPDGGRGYSRGGSLIVNTDGELATPSGHALKPGIRISQDAQELRIESDGRVFVREAHQSRAMEVGQLDVVRFAGPSAMEAIGDGVYKATPAAGEPMAGRAGRDGMGVVRQGQLEASNVKMVDEMVGLMVAQRAYEASVKVAQASDEMLGLINNLRR
jgi:flagellar basal-body rod protein FlgG